MTSDRSELRRSARKQPQREKKFADEAHFIKSWLENPVTTGAVSPSSPFLARAMAEKVDLSIPGQIIELGPGTGPVTQALLNRGVPPERLILVEFEARFCRLLEKRFPGLRIVHGDAFALGKTLQGELRGPAAAVVSGLPLLNVPEARRQALLSEAFELMHPDGVFVQFTYGVLSPIPRRTRLGRRAEFRAHSSAPIWLNLPPARIWTYHRLDACHPTTPHPAEQFISEIRRRTDQMREGFKERSIRIRSDWAARTRGKRRRNAETAHPYGGVSDQSGAGLSFFDWPGGQR